MDTRARWRSLAVIAGLVAALIGVGFAPDASAAVTKNWAGPGCPGADWNCNASTNGVTQIAAGSGSVNHANCDGSHACDVTQTASGGATNEAFCNESTAANGVQACKFDQTNDSGSNTVTGNQSASLSTGSLNLQTVTQDSTQSLVVKQQNASGSNAINATQSISQNASSILDATTPVSHTQESGQTVDANQQTSGSGNNSADIGLTRSQISNATGAIPNQKQDIDGGAAHTPNGRVVLTQHAGTGSNTSKVRGADTKRQTATSLLGDSTQAQGHHGGGWLAQLDVDSGTAGVSNIDVAAPGAADGLTKDWSQSASVGIGGTRHQSQDDDIRIPLISPKSPDNVISNEKATLTAQPGAFQRCFQTASGHADVLWTGRLSCTITDGDSTQSKTTNFSGQNINANLDCTQNAPDACSSGIAGNGVSFNAVEGNSFNGQVATFTDPDTSESGFAASIDWGDGSSSAGTVTGGSGSFSVSGTHTYADEGEYTVTTTLTKAGTAVASATSTATVADAPLTATGKSLYQSSKTFSGAVASFTDGNPNAPVSDFTASIAWGDGSSSAGTVTKNGSTFDVSGSHTYANLGNYTLTINIADEGGSTATATSTLQSYQYVAGGSFTIGDKNSAVGTAVTWWGSQWSSKNKLSGGTAPSGFKGFENSSAQPTCGTNWTSSGGSSPPPANAVPAYMATIVTSSVSGSGSNYNGNTVKMVIVKTNSGYDPNSGSAGTGTVVAVLPC